MAERGGGRKGGGRETMDDSAEIFFQSFRRETTITSSGMGEDVHSLTLSIQHFLCRQRGRPPSKVQLSPRAHLHVVGMLRFMFLAETNRAFPLLFFNFFYSAHVSASVFMAPSTVFHYMNSSDNCSLSHSVLLVLFLPH